MGVCRGEAPLYVERCIYVERCKEVLEPNAEAEAGAAERNGAARDEYTVVAKLGVCVETLAKRVPDAAAHHQHRFSRRPREVGAQDHTVLIEFAVDGRTADGELRVRFDPPDAATRE